MIDEEALWERIRRHAGEPFETKTGKPFTYEVPGNYLRITREGDEVNRSLSRINFAKAAALMPDGRARRHKGASGAGLYVGHLDGRSNPTF